MFAINNCNRRVNTKKDRTLLAEAEDLERDLFNLTRSLKKWEDIQVQSRRKTKASFAQSRRASQDPGLSCEALGDGLRLPPKFSL